MYIYIYKLAITIMLVLVITASGNLFRYRKVFIYRDVHYSLTYENAY